jgi:general secretion pathway protein D
VALAQKLVDDLDKAKPEVLIEVAVMQVSRDKAHTLGINPPTSVTVHAAAEYQHYHSDYDHRHHDDHGF